MFMFIHVIASLCLIVSCLFNRAVCVCACVQNTASPWLHHQAAGSSASDGLGLLSHVPVRPASADAHRPPVKINTHTSPPLSKSSVDTHKE